MSPGDPSAPAPLLEVSDLRTVFEMPEGTLRAVDGASFRVPAGGAVALVGESGCGKSVTALSILRLVPPPGWIVGGQILFEGRNLLALPEKEMRRVRGGRIGIVFQEPMTSLNPVLTIGAQIVEAIRIHEAVGRREARARALDLLRKVRMPDPEARIDEFPHRLSGGMRQRALLAMAVAARPALLIADEPTTALDAAVRKEILGLLGELRAGMGMAVLIITHDLPLVAGFAERVAVFYAGQVIEEAPAEEIFERPLHPYTRSLLASIPRTDGPRLPRLPTIPGAVPDPRRFPPGCRFHPRCPVRRPPCDQVEPVLAGADGGRTVRCPFADDRGGPTEA